MTRILDSEVAVRERYSRAAERVEDKLCCPTTYDPQYQKVIPAEILEKDYGCGNPSRHLRPGETVLDLGSGTGKICFIAAQVVGPSGRVIGVDMTPEMLAKARANAEKGGYTHVEFREGEIEKLPVEDNSVDIVISNCVINLSPDKEAVFSEIHRVLKPGGKFFVSDIVLSAPLPDSIRNSAAAYTACVAGALLKEDYLAKIQASGFKEVNVLKESTFPLDPLTNDPNVRDLSEKLGDATEEEREQAAQSVLSVQVEGRKDPGPGLSCCGP